MDDDDATETEGEEDEEVDNNRIEIGFIVDICWTFIDNEWLYSTRDVIIDNLGKIDNDRIE